MSDSDQVIQDPEAVKITRALLSVSDKNGIVEFATSLHEYGVELLSTGGTYKVLKEAGIPVVEVSEHTGFPEMMDGRVKTLHPTIHGGLLARRDLDHHVQAMADHSIAPIDLIVVNLYPFVETVASGADFDMCVENIDIGGPAMIRSAAKNHQYVSVVTDPQDYDDLLKDMATNEGAVSLTRRRKLAANAYARTAAYDSAIASWFARQTDNQFPRRTSFFGDIKQVLRYGENPHQSAALYADDTGRVGVANATQLQGKELSYNNLNDTDAAFELVSEFIAPTVAIIKHANPCGVASGESLSEAYDLALRCDPVSAFGGIIAMNRTLDGKTASKIIELFTEVIIAPDIDEDARAVLAEKKNLRVLITGQMPDPAEQRQMVKTISGGLLVQDVDIGMFDPDPADLQVVTEREPTDEEVRDMLFAFRVAKHVKSNAIVYAKDLATVGVGAGQMSRLDSTRIAARKAMDAAEKLGMEESLTKGSVVASDAFFPFADGLLAAAEAGATAIIQPGGSIRDKEIITAADERGLAMVLTGMRHFRH